MNMPAMNPLMSGQPMPAQVPQQVGANPLMALAQRPNAPAPITMETVDSAIKHNQTIGAILADLLAKPDVTNKDVFNGMTDAMRAGSFTPQEAAKAASNVPTDPAQLRPYLMQHFIQNMEIGRQLQAHRASRNA